MLVVALDEAPEKKPLSFAIITDDPPPEISAVSHDRWLAAGMVFYEPQWDNKQGNAFNVRDKASPAVAVSETNQQIASTTPNT